MNSALRLYHSCAIRFPAMKWITLAALASFAPTAQATLMPEFGKRDGRIIGGKTVQIEEFPFMVSIILHHYKLHCAGSIIDKEWVLTAAHCTLKTSMVDMTIQAGSIILGQGSRHRVVGIMLHPGFGIKQSGAIFNDTALFKVYPPFTLNNKTVSPVNLAQEDTETLVGENATIVGWGKVWRHYGYRSPHLHKAYVPIVNQTDCLAALDAEDNDICAGYPQGGVDSCQGDSGGPLLINGTLHGIISWGIGCAEPMHPGVYAKVAAYRHWIRETSGI